MGKLITTFVERREAQIKKERGVRTTEENTIFLKSLGYPPDFNPFEGERDG